jgi:DNA-binding response OmpR family regulator
MRILIIEDDKIMTRTLKRALNEKAPRPDIAFTGRDGLERVQNNEYDVIVLDLMWPHTDGFQVDKATL